MKKTFLLLASLLMLLPSMMSAQTDMTNKIQNADLSSNEGWEYMATFGQSWATLKGTAPFNVSEAYAGWGNLDLTDYQVSQMLVLPKGAYELSGFAFYRYGVSYDVDPTISNAVLFANEDEVAVATLGSIAVEGAYANSVDDASAQFAQGNYLNTLAFNVMEDDTEVEIGFRGTHDLKQSWFICGPVKLVQVSGTPIVADLTELIAAYNDAKAAAEAVDGKMSPEARAALDQAIATEVDMESEESLKTVTKAIVAATNAAKTSITRYEGVGAYLAKMGEVLNLTNIYTSDAYATYYSAVEEAYKNGTLTDAEAGSYNANSAYNSGWHATNFIDDVLLSAWTIGEEPVSDYTKSLYINTWSVEGITDGSNLLTPFFEYWTGDGGFLGNTTIAAKVEGVAPGTYCVQILARVRRSDSSQDVPTGITMSVNGGEAVDLCAGEQSKHETFPMMFYGSFAAEGVVGEDGVLNIEIKVDGTNCSWLAFRDVKYMTPEEKLESDLQRAYDAAMASIKEGNFYQIYTVVEGAPYYLTNTGTLTANEEEAYSFKMTQATKSGTKYAKGWNTSVPFTNPTLSNGSTGDIVNDGSIHRNNNNRDDFERQVFFEQDGKYAVRSTNGGGTNWGANTYWDQVGSVDLPEAGYSLNPSFIWILNDVTGAALLAETQAIVDAKAGVGTGLFQKPEEAYDAFALAVEDAAHVIEDITATSDEKDAAIAKLQAALDEYNNAAVNAPDPAQAYTFQQKASELFMGLSETGVNLASEENASELFFEAGENGGYFIHDAEGQYVGFAGTNNWTMSTSADNKYEWKMTLIGDNYYTLSKPSNAAHHVGTNDNDLAEGAPCYADKNNSDNSYYLWAITEVENEVAYELVDLTQADYHSWTAPDATGEITGAGFCAYEVGNTAGNIYGNPSVLANEYADLTECHALYVQVTSGQPRFLINRPTDDSQDFINIPNNGDQTAKYMTSEGPDEDGVTTYIINVAAIVADYGFCHLHAIKGANWQDATVISIEVAKEESEEPGVKDMTALIKNNAYLENGYENWTYTENAFKARDFAAPMNLITYSGNAAFSVNQGIMNVPAGLYKLTVNAFYRAGELDAEKAAIAEGKELPKWLTFYVMSEEDTYSKKVMNISEGASETSYNEGDAQLDNGMYVPNSAAGARDWYIAGEYTNELLFNVFEDGTPIVIGLEKAVGLPGDYCPIGAWHLYRLGDPDETQAQPDKEVVYTMTDLTQEDYHSWTAPDATGEITGSGYCVYEVGNSQGNIYGNPSVLANEYADLSDCVSLIVNVTEGQPRFLINRPTDDSQDFINIPNNGEQTAKYMTSEEMEDGSVSYTINVEAIVADYGFCHLHAIKGANWQNATVEYIKVLKVSEEEDVPTIEIAFDRIAGKGYAADDVEYDEAAILEALGAASWDEITTMYPVVMTTGEAGEDHDGWRNVDGDPAEWSGDGANLGLCLKYPHDGSFALCTHPGNDPEVGTEMSAAWILGTEAGKKVVVKVNVYFIEPQEITFDILDVKPVISVAYESTETSYSEKVVSLSEDDAAAVLAALGIESFEEADVYGYNPTTEKFVDFGLAMGSCDGWRDTNGDFHNWSGNAEVPACVKYSNGTDYLCYNIAGVEAQTIKTFWAITNDGKAVLVEVDFIYNAPLDPDLIEIAQEQNIDMDPGFPHAELVEGEDFNTYTATQDLTIAFKMVDVDVEGCDYVVIKFAEPVAAGWHLAFWSNQDLVDVPEGVTEYKYVFADDPKCGVVDGILPQICMMTFFGGFEAPLTAKVTGVYKHKVDETGIAGINAGLNDGKVHKVLRDGKIVIIKGDKEFNVNGAAIK